MAQDILHLNGERKLEMGELDLHTICIIRNLLWKAADTELHMTTTARNVLTTLGYRLDSLTKEGNSFDDFAEALLPELIADVQRNSNYRRVVG